MGCGFVMDTVTHSDDPERAAQCNARSPCLLTTDKSARFLSSFNSSATIAVLPPAAAACSNVWRRSPTAIGCTLRSSSIISESPESAAVCMGSVPLLLADGWRPAASSSFTNA